MYSGEFDLNLPEEIETVKAEIEWRREVDSIDVYLEAGYEKERGLAYQLLSKITPVEATKAMEYNEDFSIRDSDLEEFQELSEEYGFR